MTTIQEDNTPYKRLVEQAEGDVPSATAGGQNLFIDSTSHHVSRKNSGGSVTDLEAAAAAPDAADVTYTPGDDADWDYASDPGDVDAALDQLASRTATLEGVAPGSDSNHGYYQYLAAMLEPDAIETLQVDGFSYAVAANVTKILTASWYTRLAAAGRMEIRNQRDFLFLRGVTLAGIGSGACALIIDPALPTYANAREKYFDRLLEIATSTPQYLGIAASTTVPFLPGPYGAIVLQTTNYNSAWNSIRTNNDAYGWALVDEINDSSAFRMAASFRFAVNKKVACEFRNEAGADTGQTRGSSLVYYLCPAAWSVITDPTSYDFRDDFMGASLDTAVDWTRAQSTAGNVEINTLYQWCKLTGNSNWTTNGAYSKTGITRANGKVFLIDIYTGRNATANNSHMVGFSTGAGHSYTNYSHGLLFGSSGAANILKIYEDGNDRGTVGSGYTNGTVYRVRITLGSSNNCTYEIQGGAYGALGSASWTTLTPSSNSSSTTPLYAGFSCYPTGVMYVSDPRMY